MTSSRYTTNFDVYIFNGASQSGQLRQSNTDIHFEMIIVLILIGWIVIGVESERCASFHAALEAGQPVYTPAKSTLADGLAVPKVGINSLATAAPLVDKCIVVPEEFIAMAILR